MIVTYKPLQLRIQKVWVKLHDFDLTPTHCELSSQRSVPRWAGGSMLRHLRGITLLYITQYAAVSNNKGKIVGEIYSVSLFCDQY